jgi:hypothetical protein
LQGEGGVDFQMSIRSSKVIKKEKLKKKALMLRKRIDQFV